MKAQTITILGLDRLGASLALALKQSGLELKLVGYDRDDRLARQARKEGLLDDSSWNLINAISQGDIIIMSLPFSEVRHTLEKIGRDVPAHALILDLSPLKSPGQKWASQYLKQGHYIGAMPILAAEMLADGASGLAAARPDLFRNSLICLMPSPQADPKAVETAVNLGRVIGAQPFFIDAAEYDSLVQATDTLPGLLSAALFSAVTQARGWRDALRFAGPAFALTTAALQGEGDLAHLAFHDKDVTLHWLHSLIAELQQLSQRIYEGDRDSLAAYLEQLGLERDTWLNQRRQNEWQVTQQPDLDYLSMADRMLGRRRKSKDA